MLLTILAATVTIAVIPASCFAPCNIRVTLKVEPAKDNATVVLELGAPDSEFYRRSDIEYDAQSARTRYITYEGIPEGTYTVLATLWTQAKRVAGSAVSRVRILGENLGLASYRSPIWR